MKLMLKKFIICFFILSVFLSGNTLAFCKAGDNVRIGYFHGGRCHLLYRAYINGNFKNSGLNVELFTATVEGRRLVKVPGNHDDYKKIIPTTTRMTGLEIVDHIMAGSLDGGTIGESSFLASITKGLPIVAVASLGYTSKDKSCKALMLRNGIKINRPDDFKGKRFATRLSGPGDPAFLKEFFYTIGLDPEKDIAITENLPDEEIRDLLVDGKIDGVLSHLYGGASGVEHILKENIGYLYTKMTWLNPEMSHAVLVFHKDFIERHPDKVSAIVEGYVRRIRLETGFSEEEKTNTKEWGLAVKKEFCGMDLPIFKSNPVVELKLLKEIQKILYRYGYLKNKAAIRGYINNSFVVRATKILKKEKASRVF